MDNGSATAIELVLMPGKRYTFCIDFSSKETYTYSLRATWKCMKSICYAKKKDGS